MNLPPAYLMRRVAGNDDPAAWREVGERAAARLMKAAGPGQSVLDWGCGAGRVASVIAAGWPDAELHGCDIDAEAVAWCQANVPGQFITCPLYPPLDYPDASFDAIFAVSVMTHLRRHVQRKWLKELARMLRPGGLLLATVHGQAQAEAFGVHDLAGIRDHYMNVDGVPAPGDYYRDVIQAEAYTRDAWADWFEIVSYEPAGLELHDLVTCRKR